MSSNMSSSKRSQGDNRHGSQLSGAHLNQDQESKLDYGIDQTDVLLPRCRAIKKPYISFDRPHPEYAQSVWSLHLHSQIKQLEHSDRRVMLDLPTLLYWRERGDMIGNGDHFNTYDRSMLTKNFQPILRTTKRHDLKLTRNWANDGVGGTQANSIHFTFKRYPQGTIYLQQWSMQKTLTHSEPSSIKNGQIAQDTHDPPGEHERFLKAANCINMIIIMDT